MDGLGHSELPPSILPVLSVNFWNDGPIACRPFADVALPSDIRQQTLRRDTLTTSYVTVLGFAIQFIPLRPNF